VKYLPLTLLLFAPVLQAQICWDDQTCSEFTPIVPYVYVTPAASQAPPQFPLRARHSAPPIAVGVTPDSGPVTIMRFPDQGMTHIIQKGKVTTCFTIGANTVVCQ
jgi:hypothetical protein